MKIHKKFILIAISLFMIILSFPLQSQVQRFHWESNHAQFIRHTLDLLGKELYLPEGRSKENIQTYLEAGSEYEDTETLGRCAHHFYDICNNGWGWGTTGAYTWATLQPERNWINAISKFKEHRNYEDAYTYLGQIMHLLQDMGVPAHVRNDYHGPPRDGDYFEIYCHKKQNLTINTSGLTLIRNNTNNALFQLFDKLAHFTGLNHFSDQTIFSSKYNSPHRNACLEAPNNSQYLTYTPPNEYFPPSGGITVLHRFTVLDVPNYEIDNTVCQSYWDHIAPQVVRYCASLMLLFQDECFPKIESIKQKGAQVNDIITIIGKNFGEEYDQEESSLKFNGIKLEATDIIKWSDKEILCKIPGSVIPEGAASGTLSVIAQVHAAKSNEMAYDVGFMTYVATTAPEVYLASTNSQNQGTVTRQQQVPAGTFHMGSPSGEGNEDEHPQHEVCLDSYEIGKYEVTNRQFAKFIYDTDYVTQGDWKLTQYEITGYPDSEEYLNYPVVNVTWNDAKAFCNWLNDSGINDTEKKYIYSLPTEAQWEKAARGTDGRIYPWGNAWDAGRCNNIAGPALTGMLNLDGSRGTVEVGLFNGYNNIGNGASPYSAMDMAGNVWEWCLDWYDEHYYLNSPKDNPPGPEGGHGKVLRGGGWGGTDNVNGSRCAARSSAQPALWDTGIGFRCVRKPR